MAKHKKKNSSHEYETIEYQGVRQEYISPDDLPKRMHKQTRYSGTDSFLLEDGRYAYLETDDTGKHKMYRVLTIPNQKLLRFLDSWDKDEESLNRRNGDNASYLQINHQTYASHGDEHTNPVEIECYRQWKKAEETETTPHFPLKSEYAVIHSMIFFRNQRLRRFLVYRAVRGGTRRPVCWKDSSAFSLRSDMSCLENRMW